MEDAAPSDSPSPPLRNRNYLLLLTSQAISQLGDRFHWVAISLWVYAATRSALAVSYAIIALMVGPAVVGVFAGALVDRWDRKRTMVVADLVRGVLVGLVPLLMSRSVLLVYVDLFLVSCASAFFRPSMLASIPSIVPRVQLMRANSFLATVDTSTEVIGPLAAGLFVQAAGYPAAMYLDAGSYLVSAVLVGFLRLQRHVVAAPAHHVKPGLFGDIKEGWRYIRGDRLQFGLLMLIFLAWWVSGLNSVQTPLAKGEFGLSDAEFGWFNTIWGIGFVAASLALGWSGKSTPTGRLIGWGFLGWIFATAATGLSLNSGMLYASVFWVGFANIALFIGLSTTIMEFTPSTMLGRVIAIRQISLTAVRLAAMVGFGYVADTLGPRESVVGMAGLSLAGLLVGLALFPEVFRIGVPPAPAAAALRWWVLSLNRLRQILIEATDSSYETLPQESLNKAVLAIVGTVWFALMLMEPIAAMYVTGTVGVAVLLKSILRQWPTRGSKNKVYTQGERKRNWGR